MCWSMGVAALAAEGPDQFEGDRGLQNEGRNDEASWG